MEFFNDHRKLFGSALLFFVTLSCFVVVFPALNNERMNAPLPDSRPLTEDAALGKRVFIANGCVACHTQQVRNVDMDKDWGSRPSVAADYARNTRMGWWMNTATLMGTSRTGPDLTNVGSRLPGAEWHLLHLYNPRAVVEESIMPAYTWLFSWKRQTDAEDYVVNVPDEFRDGNQGYLVARKEALQLVAYLQSLRQTPLPDGAPAPEFLYGQTPPAGAKGKEARSELDGGRLYARNCQSCHQANGEGLKGAFPPLKGSSIVLNDNPQLLIEVIMKGYDARPEYATMPPVGVTNRLSAAEITAIVNHERSSWGNDARLISQEEVEAILGAISNEVTGGL